MQKRLKVNLLGEMELLRGYGLLVAEIECPG